MDTNPPVFTRSLDMLILTRSENQEILIGDNIRIVVLKTTNGQVRLGIDAPKELVVLRGELKEVKSDESSH